MAIVLEDAVWVRATTNPLTYTPTSGRNSNGRVAVAVFGYWTSAGPITAPTGWTLLDSGTTSSNVHNSAAVYYKKLGASEPTSYNWSWGGSLDEQIGGFLIYSGADATDPIQAYSKKLDSSGDTPTAAGVTVASQPAMLIWLSGNNSGNAPLGSMTPPTGFTERIEYDGVSYGGVYAADKAHTSTGATGDIAASFTMAAPWVTFLVALKEASAGGGGGTAKARRIQAPEGARILR